MVPNYGLYKFDWNKYMKIVNGNRESTITLGHWIGGSSHLGKSVRGLHKLEQIKFILDKYKIDILGISEANLDHKLDPCYYRNEGYDCIKSGNKIARSISYVVIGGGMAVIMSGVPIEKMTQRS